MYFYIPDPVVAMIMMFVFLGAVLLGFPIAFTLMAMGIGFGYYAYFDWGLMDHILTIEYLVFSFKIPIQLWITPS